MIRNTGIAALTFCFSPCLFFNANCSFSACSGEVQDCLSISEDEYKKTMKVNVTTPWLLTMAIAKRFRDAKSGGSIVFLTQIIGAERGLYPGAAAYGTSLGAVHQLVRVSVLVYYFDFLFGSVDSSCPNKSENWSCCNARFSFIFRIALIHVFLHQ
jgi:hypothetical protein